MSQMAQDVWISVPAVKILVKKLVEVGEVVEKIKGALYLSYYIKCVMCVSVCMPRLI